MFLLAQGTLNFFFKYKSTRNLSAMCNVNTWSRNNPTTLPLHEQSPMIYTVSPNTSNKEKKGKALTYDVLCFLFIQHSTLFCLCKVLCSPLNLLQNSIVI